METALVALVSVIGAALAAFFAGYRKAERDKDAEAARQRAEDMERAREVRNEVEGLDEPGLVERASDWVRDYDR